MDQIISGYYQIDQRYIEELYLLQAELLKLQKFVHDTKKRVAIIFEGRDTAGKGSAIARFTQHLNPQNYRTFALGKPTKRERGQWYFQRYIKRLPEARQMVFFDRSWYNRAVVEPVMGFCTDDQYQLFIQQVTSFEKMIIDDGIHLIKFWFSIDSLGQKNRIEKRLKSSLEQWKVSPVDLAAQEKWEDFSTYKNAMFDNTSTAISPWVIVDAKEREEMRIQAMRYVLSLFEYPDSSPLVKQPEISLYKKDII